MNELEVSDLVVEFGPERQRDQRQQKEKQRPHHSPPVPSS